MLQMPHGVTIKEENTKDYSPRRKVNSSAARYEPDTIIKNELCNGNGSDVGDDICDRRNFASKKESQSHTKRKHNTKRASPNKVNIYYLPTGRLRTKENENLVTILFSSSTSISLDRLVYIARIATKVVNRKRNWRYIRKVIHHSRISHSENVIFAMKCAQMRWL